MSQRVPEFFGLAELKKCDGQHREGDSYIAAGGNFCPAARAFLSPLVCIFDNLTLLSNHNK